jgi:hypothetical protein
MKKFSVLIALVLLAVAGTGFAVTCAYDNVPAATLLVPHFRVARQGIQTGDIPATQGTDTLCAITNVSSAGIIVHATLWNKYSKAVLDFNIPLTGYDVAYFSMKGVLNGNLNVNPAIQKVGGTEVCSVAAGGPGFGATQYRRFNNPSPADASVTVSQYGVPAFSGPFRQRVWDSLDETGDITSLTSPNGVNILDVDNRACGTTIDGAYAGDFGGYVTFDVVNYCTNYFPDQPEFYVNDAIATSGWSVAGYSPNTIIGDIFYVDPTNPAGNISGDQMVPIEFDTRLQWTPTFTSTFFGRYQSALEGPLAQGALAGVPVQYQFRGDGREQLGNHYGFRFLNDASQGTRSWAIVWRSDLYNNPNPVNLCDWYNDPASGGGLADSPHLLTVTTRDNDEKSAVVSGGPSGDTTTTTLFIYLETQRIDIAGASGLNPNAYTGGWIDILFNSTLGTLQNQSYVGIQHSGSGLAVSVGHSAALLSNNFTCQGAVNAAFTNGNTP